MTDTTTPQPPRPRPARPALKPALRRLRRDGARLQLGLAPGIGVVLDGVDDADARLLDLLDGSRDTAALLADAAAAGVDPERGVALLDLLHRADALDDGVSLTALAGPDSRLRPDALALSLSLPGPGAAQRALARRAETAVVVHGGSRVGAAVAGLLAAAGIGSVRVLDPGPVRPSDLSPGGIRRPRTGSRGEAASRAAAASLAATPSGRPVRRLAVVAPASASAPPEMLAAVRGRPHLLVTVRESVAAIGPLVVPGQTPCLRCLELARGERDPGWPALAAQIAGSGREVEPCDVVLAATAASLAAWQILTAVDGVRRPDTIGGVLEFAPGDGRLRRRSLSSHPACGCSATDEMGTMEG